MSATSSDRTSSCSENGTKTTNSFVFITWMNTFTLRFRPFSLNAHVSPSFIHNSKWKPNCEWWCGLYCPRVATKGTNRQWRTNGSLYTHQCGENNEVSKWSRDNELSVGDTLLWKPTLLSDKLLSVSVCLSKRFCCLYSENKQFLFDLYD